MGKITEEDVRYAAQLARINVETEDVVSLKNDLDAILAYVAQLQEVNTDNVEPTYQVTELKDVVREDTPIDYGATPDELLGSINSLKDRYIKVKRVL